MSSIRKLIRSPRKFIQDYLNKKFPIQYSDLSIKIDDEESVINYENNILEYVSNENSIDVVYTWVDGNDKKWKEKKNYYINKYINNNKDKFFDESIVDERFNFHNEIFYSVKSVKKYMPWVRYIYIITDNQVPKLEDYSNVKIINHDLIIDNEFLPTFNSHVIEANLHKIPGLSENFIYFNDDVFVARSLKKEHFFRDNGLASIFLTRRSIEKQIKRNIMTATLSATINSCNLLKSEYPNIKIDRPLMHTYIPLKKSIFEKVYKNRINVINKFSKYKFRSVYDVNFASFYVPWYMYINGYSFENVDVSYYTNMNSKSCGFVFDSLIKKKEIGILPHSFCINDVKTKNYKDNSVSYREFMTAFFD